MVENMKQEIIMPEFMKQLIDLANANSFDICKGTVPVAENEEVISEMTPFEKACKTLSDEAINQANNLLKENAPQEDWGLQVLFNRSQIFGKLQWLSIRERLSGGPSKLGIRDGWQIVEIKKKDDECDCIACQMRRGGAEIGGITIVGMGI